MRSVPYRALYGGLEVAIGLMIWMELTATVILIGAAYNAESNATVPRDSASGQRYTAVR